MEQEFSFVHSWSPGSCFLLPEGQRVCTQLLKLVKSELRNRGFEEVISPIVFKKQLWDVSGYPTENAILMKVENEDFGVKTANCLGHCLIFDHRVRSYRELPLRLVEFGVVHRDKLRGSELGDLSRVVQDDAHIFCAKSQVSEELRKYLELIDDVYKHLGLSFTIGVSSRPNDVIGDTKTWDEAAEALVNALNASGKVWEPCESPDASYAPRIQVFVNDRKAVRLPCGTIQLDFELPARFGLSYAAAEEGVREQPALIHASALGSVETMLAILLDQSAGKWPFRSSPSGL